MWHLTAGDGPGHDQPEQQEGCMKRSADNRPLLGLFRVLTLLILGGYIGAVVHLWHQNLQAIQFIANNSAE